MYDNNGLRPPFRLEPYVASKLEKIPHLLTTKTQYSVAKVSNWEFPLESQPFDQDPLCTGSQFLSHYNHLGTQPYSAESFYKTTSQEMAEQAWKAEAIERNPKRELFNFYSYRNVSPGKPAVPIPEIFITDYVTTMQHSYRMQPEPMVLHRVAMPVMPWMLYRRVGGEDPHLSKHTFYDEGVDGHVELLQKYKKLHQVSFNPLTGLYTDGTIRADPKPKCVQLELDSYKK